MILLFAYVSLIAEYINFTIIDFIYFSMSPSIGVPYCHPLLIEASDCRIIEVILKKGVRQDELTVCGNN